MAEVVDTTSKVLVGRVRGRSYSAAHLCLWVMELWGNIFKELPDVTTYIGVGLHSAFKGRNTPLGDSRGIGI